IQLHTHFNSFFFSSRRRHTRFSRDWSSDCALPIFNSFFATSYFSSIYTFFHRYNPDLAKEKVLLMLLEGSWEAINGFYRTWQREIGSAACRKEGRGGSAGVGQRKRKETVLAEALSM